MRRNHYFCEKLVAPGNPLRTRLQKQDIIEVGHAAPCVIHLFRCSKRHDTACRQGTGHCGQIRDGGNRQNQNPVVCPKRDHLRQLHQYRLRLFSKNGSRVLFGKFLSFGGVIH